MQSKHLFIKVLKLFVFFILVATLFPLGKYIFKYSPDTVPLEGDLNYGLTEEISTQALANYQDDIKGHLYFSLVEMDDASEPINVNVHAYDLQSEIPRPVIEFGTNYDIHPVSENMATVVAALEDSSDEIHELPIWFNLETGDYGILKTIEGYTPHEVIGSPSKKWGAVSFLKNDVSNRYSHKNWKIVISNRITEKSTIIENATSPQWMNGGDDLIYVKKDGIYRYNLESEMSELIFDTYQNLSSAVEIAISPKNDYMVLTLPSSDAISIIQIDDAANVYVREIGMVQTFGHQYVSPVFSPDGRFYAVVGRETASPLESNIEIWSVRSREPVDVIPLDDYIPGQLYLSAWTDFALQPIVNQDK